LSGTSDISLLKELQDKEFRHAYAARHITTGIAYQIRALREERGWSQAEMGRQAGKPQSVISRLESPNYGKLSIQTLLELAEVFDVALMVRFISFSELVTRTQDLSPSALAVPEFKNDTFKSHSKITGEITLSSLGPVLGESGRPMAITDSGVTRDTAVHQTNWGLHSTANERRPNSVRRGQANLTPHRGGVIAPSGAAIRQGAIT
jgi:transcriptional regulator with XRE-family HTH domain